MSRSPFKLMLYLSSRFQISFQSVFNTMDTETLIDPTEEANKGKTEPNDYTCNNTEDKVFFMSYEEITTHFTDSAARTSGTDYAKCQGLYVNDGYSHYWTRSPYIDYQPNLTVYYVNGGNGKCYGVLLYYAYIGVRPTICIEL